MKQFPEMSVSDSDYEATDSFLKILTVYFPQRLWKSQKPLKTTALEKKLVRSLNRPCSCWIGTYLPSKENTILPGVLGSLLSVERNSSTQNKVMRASCNFDLHKTYFISGV